MSELPKKILSLWCIIEHPYRRKANLDMDKIPKPHQSNGYIKLMVKIWWSVTLLSSLISNSSSNFVSPSSQTKKTFFISVAMENFVSKNPRFSDIRHQSKISHTLCGVQKVLHCCNYPLDHKTKTPFEDDEEKSDTKIETHPCKKFGVRLLLNQMDRIRKIMWQICRRYLIWENWNIETKFFPLLWTSKWFYMNSNSRLLFIVDWSLFWDWFIQSFSSSRKKGTKNLISTAKEM